VDLESVVQQGRVPPSGPRFEDASLGAHPLSCHHVVSPRCVLKRRSDHRDKAATGFHRHWDSCLPSQWVEISNRRNL
jgi:hypothetical protein